MNVSIYTTHQQTEQPLEARNVTAVVAVAGILTIECDVSENNYTFSAHHRFEPGRWTRFEVSP